MQKKKCKKEIDPVLEAMRLLRKDYKSWNALIGSCPNHGFFKNVFILALLRLNSEDIPYKNVSELARRMNMNRTTLIMFMHRIWSPTDYFWEK